ncbi:MULTISPECIES: hypothetical protein [Parafrankia]|nr:MULTISPECIES: hypothetical protein [Parafrankia]MBE3205286.1 hypothetical protein [Parafrankia sp. CH37]
MARVTPALDRLTETARADFLRDITHPGMTGAGVPRSMTMGDMLAARTTASAGTSSYPQLGSRVTLAVPRLYNLRREHHVESDEKSLERAVSDPALHGVGQEITANQAPGSAPAKGESNDQLPPVISTKMAITWTVETVVRPSPPLTGHASPGDARRDRRSDI